jgi:hypothetical protein
MTAPITSPAATWQRLSKDARIVLVAAVTAGASLEGILSAAGPLLPSLNLPAGAAGAIATVSALLAAGIAWLARYGIRPALPATRSGRVLGRRPARRPSQLRLLSGYLAEGIPTPPVSVPTPNVEAWGMDGNEQFGDCTIAGAGHLIAAANFDVSRTDPVPTSAEAVAQYKALTGCVTAGDSHDTGLEESALLKTWTDVGLFGDNRIAGYAPVSPVGTQMIRQAVAAYGACYVGVNLPQSAEDQFDAGEPWTYTGDQPVGGHCIVFVGYDETWLYAVTWGAVVKVAADWWEHYGEEAWAVIPQAFVEAGRGPTLDLATLRADIASLDAPPRPKPARRQSWWEWLFGEAV